MPAGVYQRSIFHLELLAKARKNIARRPLSELTKRKIGDANRRPVYFNCDYCNKIAVTKLSAYRKKKLHFCSLSCYAAYRKEKMLPHEQPSWRGGISPYEAHKRWVAKNKERMAHLKARRYARERNAEGSHTFEEWQQLKEKFNNLCAYCGKAKPLTKDHITPLSEGGSDYIVNIQPLCRNCNSRKWRFIYENANLLETK